MPILPPSSLGNSQSETSGSQKRSEKHPLSLSREHLASYRSLMDEIKDLFALEKRASPLMLGWVEPSIRSSSKGRFEPQLEDRLPFVCIELNLKRDEIGPETLHLFRTQYNIANHRDWDDTDLGFKRRVLVARPLGVAPADAHVTFLVPSFYVAKSGDYQSYRLTGKHLVFERTERPDSPNDDNNTLLFSTRRSQLARIMPTQDGFFIQHNTDAGNPFITHAIGEGNSAAKITMEYWLNSTAYVLPGGHQHLGAATSNMNRIAKFIADVKDL